MTNEFSASEVPVDTEVSPEIRKAVAEATGDFMEKLASNQEVFTKALSDQRTTEPQPKGWFTDPFQLLDSLGMGYRANPSFITYETLRQMTERDTVMSSIILTRIHQVLSFCRPQENKYSVGYKLRPKKGDKNRRLTSSEKDRVAHIEAFITNMGIKPNLERDGFTQFMAKEVRDRLTYDQVNFEKVRTLGGKLYSVFAHDASTIRIAQPRNARGTPPDVAALRKAIRYVQIVNGEIAAEFTALELAFCIANPRSSHRVYNYGFPEPQMLITTVTSHIWAEMWNQKAFCIFKDLEVITDKGLQKIEEVWQGKRTTKYRDHGRIWTGSAWSPYRVYKTGERERCRTTVEGNYTIDTSPDHQFRVIPKGSSGLPKWRKQSELQSGDWLLMNGASVEYDAADTSFYAKATARSPGRDFEIADAGPDLWEAFGWWLGDGSVSRSANDRLIWYYRRDKEEKLARRHKKILEKYGLVVEEFTEPLVGFAAASGGDSGPRLRVCQNTFIEYLEYLGLLVPGTTKKRVPKMLKKESRENRCAFLRGYFSADGCAPLPGDGNPSVSLKSKKKVTWVKPIQLLLLSLGIRARWHKSKGHLVISDSDRFTSQIGFLQDYKNDRAAVSKKRSHCGERIHPSLCQRIARHIQDSRHYRRLDRQDRKMVQANVAGREKMSAGKLQAILDKVGITTYNELLSYHQMRVTKVENLGEMVDMYDVEVFDDVHQFVGDGFVIHNSQGSTIKGVLNIQGNIPRRQYEAFKRAWTAQVGGINNAWRTPILNSDRLDFVPMQMSNTEMGYNLWIEYLVKIMCAIFQIDPAEINFDLRGSQSQQPIFMTTNEAQQKLSQDRGLKPLLYYFQDIINRHIIAALDEDFEFVFIGLDAKTEEQAIELRQKQSMTTHTLNEARALEDLPPVDNGDIVMNPTYTGYLSQQAMTQQQPQGMPGAGGEQGPEEPYGSRFGAQPGEEEQKAQAKLSNFAGNGGDNQKDEKEEMERLYRLRLNDWESSVHASVRDEDLRKSEDEDDVLFYDTIDL